MSGPRILVIDDEAAIRRFLRIALASQGYEVLEADSAAAGLEQAALTTPDLVVLDLGLPDADGKEVLGALRAWSAVPVLVLSVRAGEAEKVRCLDAGANDYVTKPFGIQELLARVRALLRQAATQDTAGEPLYDDGRLRIDRLAHRALLDGGALHLTRKEFALLAALSEHPGRVITQGQLLRRLWGPSHAGDAHYLRIVIGKLRHKLVAAGGEAAWIETEPGVGYRLLDRRVL